MFCVTTWIGRLPTGRPLPDAIIVVKRLEPLTGATHTVFGRLQSRSVIPSFRSKLAEPLGRRDPTVHEDVTAGDERPVGPHKKGTDGSHFVRRAGTSGCRRDRQGNGGSGSHSHI